MRVYTPSSQVCRLSYTTSLLACQRNLRVALQGRVDGQHEPLAVRRGVGERDAQQVDEPRDLDSAPADRDLDRGAGKVGEAIGAGRRRAVHLTQMRHC
jgi:hypothetical protein